MKTMQSIALTAFAALTASAATTSFTSTGWVTGVPVMGVWCTNAYGQIYLRSLVHTVRVESTDPLLTGRRLVTVNGGYNADGTGSLQGTSYQQIGTWDAAGTNLTPSGGVWEITYKGVMQTDNSLLLHLVGHGTGGAIDGLLLDETMTRAATTNVVDPTVPYLYTGTIQPRPADVTLLQDDFSGPEIGWLKYGPTGSYQYTRSNGQLVISGHWPGTITYNVLDTYTFGGPATLNWSVANGESVEVRADLVSLNQTATAARLVLGTDSGFYSFFKGHDFAGLSKWSTALPWGPVIIFRYDKIDKTLVPDSNVVLSLAVTKVNANVVITARVLTRDSSDRALYTGSFTDSPDMDAALTSAELLALSGMNLTLSPDLAGAPFTGGKAAVGVWQYNYDGNQPTAVAAFDNLKVPKYGVPPIGVERAVRLSWSALTGANWGIEAAPTPQGPWTDVQVDLPGMSQMTLPAGYETQVFRLVPAP